MLLWNNKLQALSFFPLYSGIITQQQEAIIIRAYLIKCVLPLLLVSFRFGCLVCAGFSCSRVQLRVFGNDMDIGQWTSVQIMGNKSVDSKKVNICFEVIGINLEFVLNSWRLFVQFECERALRARAMPSWKKKRKHTCIKNIYIEFRSR